MRFSKLRQLRSWAGWHLHGLAVWACGGPMRPGRAKRVLTRAAGCLGTSLALGASVLAVACQAPATPSVPLAVRASHRAPEPGVLLAPGTPATLSPAPGSPSPAPAPEAAPASATSPSRPPAPSPVPAAWLAYGDSITFDAFRELDGWAEAFAPAAAPEVRNAGVPGMTSLAAQLRLDALLATHPAANPVGLAFGTNDVYAGIEPVEAFIARLREMALRVRAGGRTPMLARIPWSPLERMGALEAYNEAIAQLERELGLAPGPDLYAWFREHPEQLAADGIHPRDEGGAAIRRLWAQALQRVRG